MHSLKARISRFFIKTLGKITPKRTIAADATEEEIQKLATENAARKHRIRIIHKHLIQSLGSASAFLMFFILLSIGAITIIRFGAPTPKGQAFIESKINNMRLGNAGTLEIVGFKGDLFTDFKIQSLKIKDDSGVWLEGENLEVKWNSFSLLMRKVHVERAQANIVRILRKPNIKKSGRKLSLSMEIDKIVAPIETLEAVSVKRGLWGGAFAFEIKRNHDIEINGALISAQRKGDKAIFHLLAREKKPFQVEIDAHEANGGALAGLMGLNTDLPLNIKGKIFASLKLGEVNIIGQSGEQKFLNLNGGWNETGGDLVGSSLLNASRFTIPLAKIFGSNAQINGKWHAQPRGENGIDQNLQNGAIELSGNNSYFKLIGIIDVKEKRTAEPLSIEAHIPNIGTIINNKNFDVGNANLRGKIGGGIKDWNFDGNYNFNNLRIANYALNSLNGEIALEGGNSIAGQIDANGNANAYQNILGELFGNNPKAGLEFEIKQNRKIAIKGLNINARSIRVNANGGTNIFGQSELKGKAEVGAPAVTKNALSGLFAGDFVARENKGNLGFDFDINAHGEGLKTKASVINHFLGERPKLDGIVRVSKNGIEFPQFKLAGNDVVFEGKGNGHPNPFADLSGNVKFGPKLMEVFHIKSNGEGKFQFLGLGTHDGFKLSADLNTRNFESQVSLLNEYLGSAPKIKGTLLLGANDVTLTENYIESPKIKGSLSGLLFSKSGYDLNGNWQMLVPFKVGALDVAGNPNGQIKIKGPISGPVIDINSRLAEINFQNARIHPAVFNASINLANKPFATDLTLNGNSDFGPINGKAKLYAIENGLELRGINLTGAGISAGGDANIIEGKNPTANLAFTVSKGILLQSGQLSGDLKITRIGNENYAKVNANGQNFSFNGSQIIFERLKIGGEGRIENLILNTEFTTQGIAPINFVGKSIINQKVDNLALEINGIGKMMGRDFKTQKPLRFNFGRAKTSGDGQITINGTPNQNNGLIEFNFEKAGANFDANTKLENFNLALLERDFVGSFSGTASLTGRKTNLEGALNGNIENARPRGLGQNMGLNGRIQGSLQNSVLHFEADAKNAQGLSIDVNTNLRALATNQPLRLAIDRNAPMEGNVQINGEIRPLADMIFAGERSLSGNLDLNTKLAGSINRPALDGKFTLQKGNFREPRIGLTLGNLNINGEVMNDKMVIHSLQSKDKNGGELNARGEILMSKAETSTFNIRAKKFRLVENDNAKIDASGEVNVSAIENQRGTMVGSLNIDFAEFAPRALSGSRVAKLDVEEINIPAAIKKVGSTVLRQEANLAPTNIPDIGLNVKLNAGRGVFIRGRGLNLELMLDAAIGGTLAKPELSGIAKVYRGEYEYGGRTFEFEERGTITLSSNPNNIRLNLLAQRLTSNLNAKITIHGTAAKPEIDLTSVPDLPKDEILAQVLFGRARSQLSSLETVQLATSLAALAGGDGFDVIANLRDFARLDRLVFANTASGEISIAGGKYLGRDVYIELISEGTQGISTNVEWRPVQSTAIVSKVGADGDAKISIRWRREVK